MTAYKKTHADTISHCNSARVHFKQFFWIFWMCCNLARQSFVRPVPPAPVINIVSITQAATALPWHLTFQPGIPMIKTAALALKQQNPVLSIIECTLPVCGLHLSPDCRSSIRTSPGFVMYIWSLIQRAKLCEIKSFCVHTALQRSTLVDSYHSH